MSKYRRGDKVLVYSNHPRIATQRGVVKGLAEVFEGEQYYAVRIPALSCSHTVAASELVLQSDQPPGLWSTADFVKQPGR